MTGRGFGTPLLWLALACALAVGCTGYSRNVLSESGENKVVLRSNKAIGGAKSKGYDHPITISKTRAAHILSRIDVRTDDKDAKSRKPAIPGELVYELGEKLADALAKASPDEEVVIVSNRRSKSLGVFTRDNITSFYAYVKNDMLHIRLFHLDWEKPAGGPQAKVDEPVPDREVMKFRTLPGEGMLTEGDQGVVVSWRDPIFKSPTAVRITPTGKIVRRTILLESEEESAVEEQEETLPSVTSGSLSPEQLRALADLEEGRRDGVVSETEYQSRRIAILRGQLQPEAGDDIAPD